MSLSVKYGNVELANPSGSHFYIAKDGISEVIPSRRGGNIVIPNLSGSIYAPKVFGEGYMTLGMLITDKSMSTSEKGDEYLRENIDYLKSLFGRSGLNPLVVDFGYGYMKNEAEVRDEILFRQVGPTIYSLAVTLWLPYPFWTRDEPQKYYDIADINIVPIVMTVLNDSSAPIEFIKIRIHGSITQPELSNGELCWLRYNGTIPSGKHIEVDTENWSAILYPDGVRVDHAISHGGSARWFYLVYGENTIRLDGMNVSDSRLEIQYQPRYL